MNLAEKPEWFDGRRFVVEGPQMFDGFTYHRERAINGWGVRDLATNIVLITDVTGEEASVYADALETKYNRYLSVTVEDRE